MQLDRNLQILGLAKKAGLLAIGGDAAGIAARKVGVSLIISASDASERAHKNARIDADAGGALHAVVPYTMFELGNAIGRGSPGTVAFLDMGLAVKFLKGLAESQPEPFGKLREFLEKTANDNEDKKTLGSPGNSAPIGKRRTKQ